MLFDTKIDDAKLLFEKAKGILDKYDPTAETSATVGISSLTTSVLTYHQHITCCVYDALAEYHISRGEFVEAEEIGKKSLEITNKLGDKKSMLVEWCLHLMVRSLIGQQKYFYAEGLLRRLEGRIFDYAHQGIHTSVPKRVYNVQKVSLETYRDLLKKFQRLAEAETLQTKIDSLGTTTPDIEMHALFRQYLWRIKLVDQNIKA